MPLLISVVICTYARAEALTNLLRCLHAQSHRSFEVLIVDGSGENTAVRDAVHSFQALQATPGIDLAVLQSAKGLTRQRNTALQHAQGELVFFFDDDVSFGNDFFMKATALFARPDLQDVGGLTGYDELNYPAPISMRWRIRSVLGVVPGLQPGSIDRFGRSVPLTFLRPFCGTKPVGYFGGFCMMYRRSAIRDLWFDEQLPTYAGEDRDYSFRVAQRSRLLICGDLVLKHHHAMEARDHDIHRSFQDGFGTGRMFAKQSTFSDFPLLLWVVAAEILVGALACVRMPSRNRLAFAFARPAGILAGFRSYNRREPQGRHCTPSNPQFQNSK